ncbi:hypothetical protein KZZ52_15300 [Dactylosporangium sp. AC04546]|uniref:hypothetical protein n=1 Tax=Dactylosporangium sp. AC04546 TaxID=2862460 RepID=UPI001EDFE899|nr:hypothetical protein [Dactylosporangium sp. AC04546]WVK86673.1 hypothetical protein KZZ52_15300 [Dactylosporangium sp. AC04546]
MRAAPLPRWAATATAAVVLALGPALPGYAQPSPGPSTAVTKYYVVGPPVDGHREYLFDIAARTLGNGRRAAEIFNLNQHRPQPDGGRLQDPTVLQEGWILLLPPDADGPGVHEGEPPAMPTSAEAGNARQVAEATRPTSSVSEVNARVTTIRIGLLMATVGLLAASVRLLRGGRRRPDGAAAGRTSAGPARVSPPVVAETVSVPAARPADAGMAVPADVGWEDVPHRPMVPPGATAGRPPAVPEWTQLVPMVVQPAAAPWTETADRRAPNRAAERAGRRAMEPPVLSRPGRPPLTSTGSAPAGDPPATPRRPAGQPRPHTPAAAPADIPADIPAEMLAEMPAEMLAGVRAETGRPGSGARADGIDAELSLGDDVIRVRLAGGRGTAPAITWSTAGEEPADAVVPVYLGQAEGRCLYLDLAQCPDVVAVTGESHSRERLALAMVDQLSAGIRAFRVTVVGRAIGGQPAMHPSGYRKVRRLADVRTETAGSIAAHVVFCDLAEPGDAKLLRDLMAGCSGVMVPVIVGDVPRARWSLSAAPYDRNMPGISAS